MRSFGRPAPVAVSVEQHPGFASQRSRQMRDHGVDANDKIEPPEQMSKCHDVRRTDVLCAGFGKPVDAGSALKRIERDAVARKTAQEPRRHGTPLVPGADLPDQPDGQAAVLIEQLWARYI